MKDRWIGLPRMRGGSTCIQSPSPVNVAAHPPGAQRSGELQGRGPGALLLCSRTPSLCPTSPRGETPKATLGPLVALSSSSSQVSSIVPVKAGKDGDLLQSSLKHLFADSPSSQTAFLPPALPLCPMGGGIQNSKA